MHVKESRRRRNVGTLYLLGCFKLKLCLVSRAEEVDLLSNGLLDSLTAGSEKLSGIEALALKILACLNVLTGCSSEGELALGVYL